MGVHGLEQNDKGYDSTASVEYLGADITYDLKENKSSDYTLTLARVRSLEPFSWQLPSMSWKLNFHFDKVCIECPNKEAAFYSEGGIGLNYAISTQFFIYTLINARLVTWQNDQLHSVISPGYEIGSRLGLNNGNITISVEPYYYHSRWLNAVNAQGTYYFTTEQNLFLQFKENRYKSIKSDRALAGWQYFW
ncbi:MAG: hypothetical protein A2Z20_05595 [Bdellovibrionales bacterium RBG_16_40_8]|nr:MAG: hypothetical protein A2Z20_05595 [Bdellovibrionales bacterium RBG_16_40_8]